MTYHHIPREPSDSLPGRIAWTLVWLLAVPLPALVIIYLLLGH